MSSSIQLFRIGDQIEALAGSTVHLEAALQRLIENNMEAFLISLLLPVNIRPEECMGGELIHWELIVLIVQ